MKKIKVLLLTILLLVPGIVSAGQISVDPAGQLQCLGFYRLSANKTSAVANGTDSITLSLVFQSNPNPGVSCAGGGGDIPGPYHTKLQVSGSGNTLSTTTFTRVGSFPEGQPNPYYYYNSIVLKSAVAGVKSFTLTPKDEYGNVVSLGTFNEGSVNFTAPPAPKSTTTTQSNVNTQTQTKKPVVPAVTEVKLNSEQYQKTSSYQYSQGEAVTFSGKALPNAKVTLTFNSEPFTDTVTADANGEWTYTLTEDLGNGDHTMTYTITDPKTSLTSEPSEPVKFAFAAKKEVTAAPVVTNNPTISYWWYVGGGLLVLILLVILGVIIWNRKRKEEVQKS